jgi:hypothetical protein
MCVRGIVCASFCDFSIALYTFSSMTSRWFCFISFVGDTGSAGKPGKTRHDKSHLAQLYLGTFLSFTNSA